MTPAVCRLPEAFATGPSKKFPVEFHSSLCGGPFLRNDFNETSRKDSPSDGRTG